MTMKFGDVILHQKLYQKIIKHLMTSLPGSFYDIISYFRLCSAKKVENPNFLVFMTSSRILGSVQLKLGFNGDTATVSGTRKISRNDQQCFF